MISSVALFDDILFDGITALRRILKEKNEKVPFSKLLNTRSINLKGRRVIGYFISNNSDLASELLAVKKNIENYFTKKETKRPLNILLSASPGSGKSFLLKQINQELANHHKTEYKEFNLSTVVSKEEIFEISRFIQEKNSIGIIPIIFIDEVDTIINGEYVFPYLISAMSDGITNQTSIMIKCDKAIIAFAGSGLFENKGTEKDNIAIPIYKNYYVKVAHQIIDLLKSLNEKQTYFEWRESKIATLKSKAHLINKFPDFLDRVDLFLMLPPTQLKLSNYSLEQELIDLAVSLIGKHFKDVKKVEMSYLLVIMTLILTFETKRIAESVIFLTANPTKDIIRFHDLPFSVIQKFESKFSTYKGRLIKIITN